MILTEVSRLSVLDHIEERFSFLIFRVGTQKFYMKYDFPTAYSWKGIFNS